MSLTFSSLPEALLATIRQYPNQLALVDPPSLANVSFTYHQMKSSVCSVATWMVEQGVEPGDRLGLIAPGRAWWPVCDFATMSTGAWTVPIYPSIPWNQVGFIVRHAGMTGIFVENQKQFVKLVKAHTDEALPLRFVVILDDEAYKQIHQGDSPWTLYSYQAILQTPADEPVISRRIGALSLDDGATIVYTSGTTGTPKGVLLTHGNILSNIEGIRERLELRLGDVHLSYLPLSHIFERTCGEFIMLLAGVTVCYAENIDTIVQDFARIRPTTFTTVPRLLEKVQERVDGQMRHAGAVKARMYRRAMNAGMRERVDRQSVSPFSLRLYERLVFKKIKDVMGGRLRMIVSGGAPLAPYVGRFFMAIGLPIFEGYGMTETSPVIAFNSPDAPRLGTVGQRLSNVEVMVAEDGELLVRGPSIMLGYYHNPEATDQAFTADGWLKTGDMAEVSADGFIRITDRKKHLIVLSTGKKVTPAPIENDIIQSPFIDQTCLIGQGYKFVSAIVVPNVSAVAEWKEANPAKAEDERELTALLEAEVARTTSAYARFEQPKRIIIAQPFTLENDMLTPSLKIKANKVVEAYAKEIQVLYQIPSFEQESRETSDSRVGQHPSKHTVSQ